MQGLSRGDAFLRRALTRGSHKGPFRGSWKAEKQKHAFSESMTPFQCALTEALVGYVKGNHVFGQVYRVMNSKEFFSHDIFCPTFSLERSWKGLSQELEVLLMQPFAIGPPFVIETYGGREIFPPPEFKTPLGADTTVSQIFPIKYFKFQIKFHPKLQNSLLQAWQH